MSEPPETLDDQVRRADPDRWLASRFIADAAARADVIALYALNHELARVAASVREPLMGEIRLTWWREALEEVAAGKPPRRHPVVEAVSGAFSPAALALLPEGRFPELDKAPFADEAALLAYLDTTAGAVMALAAARLDPAARAEQVRSAARAFGIAGLSRMQRLAPDFDVAGAVKAQLKAARAELKALPVAAFPAVAYAALAAPYARGRDLGEFGKRLRLTAAVLRGRV